MKEKHRIFAQEYLTDMNATQAAIRAGYSKNTGWALLQHPQIAAYVKQQQQERVARCRFTGDRVLEELCAIAFASSADFMQIAEGGALVLVPTSKWKQEQRAAVVSMKESTRGVEIRLGDKLRALELLGKHMGLFAGDGDDGEIADDALTKSLEAFTEE